MVTSLRRREIVIGKMLPYLAISILLDPDDRRPRGLAFRCRIRQPAPRAHLPALSALLVRHGSVHLRLLARQTQAIQFSVFFLLPVFVFSGAFAPLQQSPTGIRWISEFSRSPISAAPFAS